MFFRKKKEVEEDETPEEPEEKREDDLSGSADAASLIKINAGLEKLKAQFATFYEMQKTSNERFSAINEQIGGLRSQMMDREKESQTMEAKAMKAIDMVESVQPDKLMIEVKKMENKIELIKSNVESNEILTNNNMNEMKELRNKINAMKGIEESIKLAEEVKKDWLENKKVDATITKHSNKVEMIYSEMWKEFGEFKKFSGRVEDLDKSMKQVSTEMDSIVVKMKNLAEKKEVENLLAKFDNFQKHIDNIVYTLNNKLMSFENEIKASLDERFEKAENLIRGIEILAKNNPDLDRYFNLIESEGEKSKPEVKVEKIKKLGEGDDLKEEQKPNIMEKISDKIGKGG